MNEAGNKGHVIVDVHRIEQINIDSNNENNKTPT